MRIIMIGPHPDDCEISAGGVASLWRERGDDVRMVSVTDGRCGHFQPEYLKNPDLLVERRLAESAKAASVIGASWANLRVPDGRVYVNPETTEAVIREIRAFKPDLVLLNRPYDVHRDHRYAAQMVLDTSYLLTVPGICPDVPILETMPVFAYWHDGFKDPVPFRADRIVAIDRVIDKKTQVCVAHESQFFEWLPYNIGLLDQVPANAADRIAWFHQTFLEPHHDQVRETCLASPGAKIPDGRFFESFQISEHGRLPSPDEWEALFP